YTSTGKVVKCPSGTAIMEVNMQYVPHNTTRQAAVQSKPMALKVNPTALSPEQPAAVLVSLTLSKDVGTVSEAIIEEGLKDWLNGNLREFDHIFSVVDLNRMIDQKQWGFVTPNYTSYCFMDADNLQDSVLGVLTMTGNRTGEHLDSQLSNNIIPSGSVAGFLVSQQRTLLDLVRPAIEQAYPGLTDDNFLIDNSGTKLYLKDGVSVKTKPVVKHGSTYYPVLKQLSIEATGQILTLQSYTETEVAAGITAQCTATNWYEIQLGTSSKGQTLKFVKSQKGDIVHKIHQSEGSILTKIIIELVAAVALIILTIVTDGAALVVGGLIIAMMRRS
ncbi:MAG: TULIP family P47-like protein, partial [Bacteroidota bacterium]